MTSSLHYAGTFGILTTSHPSLCPPTLCIQLYSTHMPNCCCNLNDHGNTVVKQDNIYPLTIHPSTHPHSYYISYITSRLFNCTEVLWKSSRHMTSGSNPELTWHPQSRMIIFVCSPNSIMQHDNSLSMCLQQQRAVHGMSTKHCQALYDPGQFPFLEVTS